MFCERGGFAARGNNANVRVVRVAIIPPPGGAVKKRLPPGRTGRQPVYACKGLKINAG